MDLSVLWWWTSLYQNLTGWPSQKCEHQSFVFQKVPIWQQLLANQLEGFECNFRCLKWFFRKLPRKVRSAFFLKKRFLNIRILVTWLKCLFTVYLMNHLFKISVLLIPVMKCIMEVNWLRKHLKKVRSSQPVILVLNWINFSLEYR